MKTLLSVENINVDFIGERETVRVVSDLSFDLKKGQVLGIVGESGSGKSVTSLAIMRLLPALNARVSGRIVFDGQDMLALGEQAMQGIRGKRIAMIFQEPMTSLNPIHTCGKQVMEAILLHSPLTARQAQDKAQTLLATCGIPDPARRMGEYPHQLSGGLRQRVMIAIALASDPDLLIADEPTTALDVTIQAQILTLLKDIRRQRDMGIILITHDLGIVSGMCDRVAVMYCGQLLETAPVRDLFRQPLHPYTRGLIDALPRLDGPVRRLEAIDGMVPDAGQMPQGCCFHPRCKQVMPICRTDRPALTAQAAGRHVRCFLYDRHEREAQA